jgi:hypothetical protein
MGFEEGEDFGGEAEEGKGGFEVGVGGEGGLACGGGLEACGSGVEGEGEAGEDAGVELGGGDGGLWSGHGSPMVEMCATVSPPGNAPVAGAGCAASWVSGHRGRWEDVSMVFGICQVNCS